MPHIINSWRRTVFAVSLVVLMGIGLWATSNLFALIANSRAVAHTSEVDRGLERMLFLMSDADTNERAYLITGEKGYLSNYHSERSALFAQLKTLRNLMEGEPHQQHDLQALAPLLQARVGEMQQAIQAQQQKGLNAARLVVCRNLSLKTLDKCQALINDVEDQEDQRLNDQTQKRDASAQRSVLSFIIGTGLVVGLLLASGRALQREITQRRQSEAAVRQLNIELEGRVQQRTEHLERAQARIQSYVQELQDVNVEMLERLAWAGEFRDDDTGQHTQRVGLIADLLAQKLGFPRESVRYIHQAARLHDLGKIGVSDLILLKPGKLTEEEFDLMKEHTTIGAALFKDGDSELIQMAQRIALSHHERFDGTGYPQGLKAEAIPLEARLVTVADVFDALTHERPYKAAWPVAKAVAEIVDQSGRQFDPQVVEAFLTLPHEDLV